MRSPCAALASRTFIGLGKRKPHVLICLSRDLIWRAVADELSSRRAEFGHDLALVEGRNGAVRLMGWAKPRSSGGFEIDMEYCPNSGGELKISTAILETAVVAHLGLQARRRGRLPVP